MVLDKLVSDAGKRSYQKYCQRGKKDQQEKQEQRVVPRSAPQKKQPAKNKAKAPSKSPVKIGEKAKTPHSLPAVQSYEPPTLVDIVDYFENPLQGRETDKRFKPIKSEARNCILSMLSLMQDTSFMVVGPSGSAKTQIVNRVLEFIPKHDLYSVNGSTPKGLLNDHEVLNSRRHVYIPEAQNVLCHGDIYEMFKRVIEGEDHTFPKTVGGKTRYITITKGKTFISTLATDNKWFKANHTELFRRLLLLRTDNSKEATRKFLDFKYQPRAPDERPASFPKKKVEAIRKHLQYCRGTDVTLYDPFSIVPMTCLPEVPKTKGYSEFYDEVLSGLAKFDSSNSFEYKGLLFTKIQHHYLCRELFFDYYCDALKQLDDPEFHDEIEEKRGLEIDWSAFFEKGASIVEDYARKKGDLSIYEQWLATQIEDDQAIAYNPINNEDVRLF